MASANIAGEDASAINSLRAQIKLLLTRVNALQVELGMPGRLFPEYSHMMNQIANINKEIREVVRNMQEQQEALRNTVMFPLPAFPGKYHSGIVDQLFRTKMEPNVQEWIDATLKKKDTAMRTGLNQSDRRELWQSGPALANAAAAEQTWGADYTITEVDEGIENVLHGLQRTLVVPEVEEEEGDNSEDVLAAGDPVEDKMEVEKPANVQPRNEEQSKVPPAISAPARPLIDVLRFMSKG